MTDAEALQMISDAVAKAKGKPATITGQTHLIRDNILDSLDSIRFLFELEKLTGVKFPDADPAERGLYTVAKLIEFIQNSKRF